ncbi:hypothetical protein PC129_g14630 [Phytophthora cactorum]|uniref:Uncharacterized protein n=1 Tax=Phytophthora cactorum TaxID=29920 RepID=A0A329RQG5_9STRA|nr:hypothetical protein GQ600_19352 [Phytophthora cactorum]KAG2783996.1 hypothetical protein Pcac1_g6268 [Phytophthora cactorum]KAG2804015.1 hypothetical protein PC112_g18911 [Phytophthora cactorum]KAG2805395.1 hypothetical protein PC111_g17831 [Phytophthora cactorum]KAG2842498.1 hypothetical protein PC113_g18794 [Phytophthora cactorum]
MDSMLNKAKETAEQYSGHGNSHKDASNLHHIQHETEKMYMKHAAKDYAEDHGFSKNKHHDKHDDESFLNKAKNQYSGHRDSHRKKDDESFLDKAKDQYSGHGDSHRKKDGESFQDKAKETVGQYTHKH